MLTVQDLAVGCDGRRMYLAAPAQGHRVDPISLHALNLRNHTPPLARLLTELPRALCAQVTTFDWGAAARLPFLPRLWHGRTILTPARWRLEAAELPARTAAPRMWDEALATWCARRRVPRLVQLVENDRRLQVDLHEAGDRQLLRAHLAAAPYAVLEEATGPTGAGWCDGRAHEIVVPLRTTEPPPWPRLPHPTPARLIGGDQGQTPGTSRVMFAKLYGDVRRQDLVLAMHVPQLLAQWEAPPAWWFLRYRDPDPHLRLRIALPDPDAFGPATQRVSAWAEALHHQGLLREVQYATSYPETGRWGAGPALTAAEEVFGADSHAVVTQLSQSARPHPRALVAAHTVAIAVAFTGSTPAGMQWLIDHLPAASPTGIPRHVYTQAIRLADPTGDWAALRAAPGGAAIVDAWKPRDEALAAYRTHLPGPHTTGIDVDAVLGSLLHVHFVRAVGIDFDEEAIALRLARAAALSWRARNLRERP